MREEKSESKRVSDTIENGDARYSCEQNSVRKHQNRIASKGDYPVDKVGAYNHETSSENKTFEKD